MFVLVLCVLKQKKYDHHNILSKGGKILRGNIVIILCIVCYDTLKLKILCKPVSHIMWKITHLLLLHCLLSEVGYTTTNIKLNSSQVC